MEAEHFKKVSGTSRSGYAMLIMILIVIRYDKRHRANNRPQNKGAKR